LLQRSRSTFDPAFLRHFIEAQQRRGGRIIDHVHDTAPEPVPVEPIDLAQV
jgi:hypothetical protein